MKRLAEFWSSESGQDLVEYELLVAFVVVISAALLVSGHDSVARIWTINNENLSKAKEAAGN